MKVRVQSKPSAARLEKSIVGHIEVSTNNSLENRINDIPENHTESSLITSFKNTLQDVSESHAELSLTNSIKNIVEKSTEFSEGEASGQTEPIVPARSVLWELGRLIVKITVIAACFMLIGTFLYGFHRSSDPDMAPMVKDGDLLLFYRLDKDYSIGDLLLLDFQGERQVRRVVAGAGDTVDITEDGLIINGNFKNEPEIYEQTLPYENRVQFPLTVGEGQVFTLGDARENATDSRVYGPVDTEDTLGTVITVMRRRSL